MIISKEKQATAKAPFTQGGLCALQNAHDYATILPTKARVFYDQNTVCLPWQDFPRILKSPCASKEICFPKLHLPTIYQRNRRAKLAVNTQTPVHGRFCHRTGAFAVHKASLDN